LIAICGRYFLYKPDRGGIWEENKIHEKFEPGIGRTVLYS